MGRRQALDGVELIEILDPAELDAAWGADAPSSGPSPPRPDAAPDRRATFGLLAVVAVAAAAWAAVTWLGGSDEPPAVPQRRFVLEAEGLTPYSADLVDDDASDSAFGVWGDASGTLEVVARRAVAEPLVFRGAWVEDVAGVTAVHTLDPDGTAVVTVERALPDGWSAVVRGRGMPAADVAVAAATVRVEERTDGTSVELGDGPTGPPQPALLRGADPDHAVHGGVDSVLRYTDRLGAEVTLRVAEGEGADGLAAAVAALQVVGADVVGADGRVGARLPAQGLGIAVWAQGGALLSVTGPQSPEQLLEWSRMVRAATDEEWSALLRGLQPSLRLGDTSVIDTGEDDAGQWIAGVQRVVRGDDVSLQWWCSEPGDPAATRAIAATVPPDRVLADGEVVLDTVVVGGVTYAFVRASADMDDRRVAVAQFGDGPPPFAPVRLSPAFLDDGTLMGVVRFVGPGTVRLVTGT